jgi:hypothetical protein
MKDTTLTELLSKKYQYITIKQVDGDTFDNMPMFSILNNKSGFELGMIFYYKPWKQYVFSQSVESAVFNNGCLKNIIDFIENEIDKLKK